MHMKANQFQEPKVILLFNESLRLQEMFNSAQFITLL